MPWSKTEPSLERAKFVADYYEGLYDFKALCDRYFISRPTGYKWLKRFQFEGVPGLEDRSHAPRQPAGKTPQYIEDQIVEVRDNHQTWGPEKIQQYLLRRKPDMPWPNATSTFGAILKRNGLIKPSKKNKHKHPGTPPLNATEPNQVWGADFKGEFKLGNGVYCYPLTISDLAERFVIECKALSSTRQDDTIPVFKRTFLEFGLPDAIRTDNGVPFATRAIFGLSKLNVWWIKLGITHQRIKPATPTQNSRHERMHKTLKDEATRPPGYSFPAQQRKFDKWMDTFNFDRPHDGINGRFPADRYRTSAKSYPSKIKPPEYPLHYETRRVCNAGTFRFRGAQLFLSNTLIDEWIGFHEVNDSIWEIKFYDTTIARFDQRIKKLI